MFAKILTVIFKSFVVEECFMMFEKMGDDRIDILGKELSDLILFGVDLVFDIFDAVFSGFGAVLDEFFNIGYELAYFITHMILYLNCQIF